MKPHHTLEQKVINEVAAVMAEVIEHEGFELVDVTYRREPHGWILRVFIDRDDGVTIDDCTLVSRQLSDLLDVKADMPQAYRLEVSSPGLNRPLTKPADFLRFQGKRIRLRTHTAIDGRKNFTGKLLEFRDGNLFLDIEGTVFQIAYGSLEKANLIYDFHA